GSIQFNGTVNGPNSLALAAGDTGNILFNGNAGVLNGLNITSANDLSILGLLQTTSMDVNYRGNFTTGPNGFLDIGSLYLNPNAQSATLVGMVDGIGGKAAALRVDGPVGDDAFTINGCTIGIPCEIPPQTQPVPMPYVQPQLVDIIASSSIKMPTILASLARHRPPSDDPTQYQFSNLGNEELWDNNPGAYSVSSFAVFGASGETEENIKNNNAKTGD
ncbi:MAG: hypothetical protein ACU836_19205, partial [Gammaproteobacteria bacterium]